MKESTKNPGSVNHGNNKEWDRQHPEQKNSHSQNQDRKERERTNKTGLHSDSRLETTAALDSSRKSMNQDEQLKPHTTGKEKKDNDMPRSNEKADPHKSGRTGNADSGRGSGR